MTIPKSFTEIKEIIYSKDCFKIRDIFKESQEYEGQDLKDFNEIILQLIKNYFVEDVIGEFSGNNIFLYVGQYGHLETFKAILPHIKNIKFRNSQGDNILSARPYFDEEVSHEMATLAFNQLAPEEFRDFILQQNSEGQNSIHLACKYCQINLLRYFKTKCESIEIDFNCKDSSGQTPLMIAIDNGNIDIVKFLVDECQVSLQPQDEKNRTIFHHEAMFGSTARLRSLMDTKDINFYPEVHAYSDSITTFRICEPLDTIKFLAQSLTSAEFKAELEKQDSLGRTPLHYAAMFGEVELVEYLVSKGADVNCKDRAGLIPLGFAANGQKFKNVEFLVKHSQNLSDQKDANGKTILHYAARYCRDEFFKELVTSGKISVNCRDTEGRTALIDLIFARKLNLIKFLIETDSSVLEQAVDSEGGTALHYAAMKGITELIAYLVKEKNMEVDCVDNDGRTPLMWAAGYGKLDAVKVLVEQFSASIDKIDGYGISVLTIALTSSNDDLIRYLISKTPKKNLLYSDNKELSAVQTICLFATFEADPSKKDQWNQLAKEILSDHIKTDQELEDYKMISLAKAIILLKYSDFGMAFPQKLNLSEMELKLLEISNEITPDSLNLVKKHPHLVNETLELLQKISPIQGTRQNTSFRRNDGSKTTIVKSSQRAHESYFVIRSFNSCPSTITHIDGHCNFDRNAEEMGGGCSATTFKIDPDKVSKNAQLKDSLYKLTSFEDMKEYLLNIKTADAPIPSVVTKLQMHENCGSKSRDLLLRHLLESEYNLNWKTAQERQKHFKQVLIERAVILLRSIEGRSGETNANLAKDTIAIAKEHAMEKKSNTPEGKAKNAKAGRIISLSGMKFYEDKTQ